MLPIPAPDKLLCSLQHMGDTTGGAPGPQC